MPRHSDIEAFHEVLRSSRRILALCGAGLSASSGLPTFRDAGGVWRNHDPMKLATMEAFQMDPGLVWLFYGYRRHMSLVKTPNPAHRALAELAKRNPNFLCLTQNVDNLSQRAGHPLPQLRTLHGSLFDIKCSDDSCTWIERGNEADPFCPALAPASEDPPEGQELPLLNPYHRIKHISEDDLPKCPSCKEGLQRPGVVWFGEMLDEDMMMGIQNWLSEEPVVRCPFWLSTVTLLTRPGPHDRRRYISRSHTSSKLH
jgi:NAD-dependent deacetylase sirtuin 5